MILADTSIWIDHLRFGDEEMRRRLSQGEIAAHPFVVAELALGSLRHRRETLALLDLLPAVRSAHVEEVRTLVETHRLHGRGIGLTDAHLLAAALLTPPTLLWTRDKPLRKAAESLGIQVNLA